MDLTTLDEDFWRWIPGSTAPRRTIIWRSRRKELDTDSADYYRGRK
jgi:hypothetical protein